MSTEKKDINKKIRVFIAGDSTAATKLPEKRPETGWGQVIQEFFNDQVEFHNHAVNGRSSKSFINEDRLLAILNDITPDDFLFIQFGHNDEKDDIERHTDPFTTYKAYLLNYIEVARKAGAFPVLLTPIQRRSFDSDEILQETHGDYPLAMKELAVEHNVTLIDMSARSKVFFEKLGPEKTKELFLWLNPGESPNYPDGVNDNTHFSEAGAKAVAKLIMDGIIENKIETLLINIKNSDS